VTDWSFVIAGLFGGIGRSVLFLLSIQGGFGSYTASLIETAGFVLGTFIFGLGQIKERPAHQPEQPVSVVSELF
jgi:hypothetical protein